MRSAKSCSSPVRPGSTQSTGTPSSSGFCSSCSSWIRASRLMPRRWPRSTSRPAQRRVTVRVTPRRRRPTSTSSGCQSTRTGACATRSTKATGEHPGNSSSAQSRTSGSARSTPSRSGRQAKWRWWAQSGPSRRQTERESGQSTCAASRLMTSRRPRSPAGPSPCWASASLRTISAPVRRAQSRIRWSRGSAPQACAPATRYQATAA